MSTHCGICFGQGHREESCGSKPRRAAQASANFGKRGAFTMLWVPFLYCQGCGLSHEQGSWEGVPACTIIWCENCLYSPRRKHETIA